ncbi:hypothetical protein U27_06319 [Candidatus Vecturithrix granuli]|uniref:CRISPR type III-associated protein domain-containing protein n=1 Tax=Vecturithrix granuli TaxID=1499967 RepID=A0A081C430_VECG1|nr:hypothetical protein U27_06319 [Candidatus Vecturithrix granuli]
MEKAKLIIKTTKKGKHIAELLFLDTNKTMPFPQFTPQNASMNGQEVEVQREQGKISKVQTEGKVIYAMTVSPPSPSRRPPSDDRRPSFSAPRRTDAPRTSRYQTARPGQQISNVRSPAHAPYNFIPLNEKIIAAEKIPGQDFPLNVYHQTRHTGWIDLEIETQTPLYIRDALTMEESNSDRVNPDFFSPNGQPQIPGSSLRGMVRMLVEIVSFGKFGAADREKRFYFRGLADKSNLRQDYQERMSSFDRKSRRAIYKMSAGVLRKKGRFDYEIVPSEKFWQIAKPKAQGIVKQLKDQRYGEFKFYETGEGYLVVSGNMQNKKKDWMIAFPSSGAKAFPIHEDDIKDYKDDATRADTVPNLVELANRKQYSKGVPCFYVKWQDRFGRSRVSFGHTAMFRLAYERTVGEHLPDAHNDDAAIDIAEAIFGNEKTFAGRVFFEDARLNFEQTDVLMGEATPKILSSPKPTTFQHYLTQHRDDIRQLSHYNTNALIRGNKLYWHKSGDNWQETDEAAITQHQTQYTKINPVKPQTKFTGRIRFENLSDVELGALLFSLDLPEGCCHKLGMGKPLGLGSVKIIPKLFLSDRKQRYSDFLAEFDLQESQQQIPKFKQKFELHICEALREQNVHTLWDVKRLKELRTMLDFEKGVELEKQEKIRYMQITPQNEFKDRPVLPMPTIMV